MTIKADRIFGAVFLALGLGLFIYSFSFHSGDLMGDLGPGFLPGLVGALLGILGLVQLIWPGEAKREPIEGDRVWIVLAFTALVGAYAVLFAAFGFSWPSFGFLVAVMLLLGGRTPRLITGYVIGSAFFVFLVGFVLLHVLSVPLRGVWFLN
jgi:putative tricarboxylic transport membrane protein